MIITGIKIKNFFSFKDIFIDLSIKRKSKHSTIPDEFLEEFNNFRFKKVCIISGSNSSGKSSLGKLLYALQALVCLSRIPSIEKFIYDKSSEAEIEIEYVFPNDKYKKLNRLKLVWHPSKLENVPHINATYYFTRLRLKDTVYSARKRVNLISDSKKSKNYYEFKENIFSFEFFSLISQGLTNPCFGWFYQIESNIQKDLAQLPQLKNNLILEAVLKTFDPSIENISENKDDEHNLQSFTINFKNKDKLVLDTYGDITNKDRLSNGTFNGLAIARLFDVMVQFRDNDISSIFYVDEAMAYVHTEIEQEMISLIIQNLPRHSQLFYTTHNYDVLDLNLPVHSYIFMNKPQEHTSVVQAEDKIKKNDRSLIGYLRNNVFGTIPDTSKLEDLLDV
ncbi:ATP-binding protein [Taylorella asinigenitalis]|uniref:ATPase AAA-type core domain-containing protein n=1 Tax=Taylorella asinigenitalis (strain MCE3) TaxID=1008459 RepID=G4QDA9_TAYAM|nr:ATP-binding protein [Taylorella asinigenitalis]AEP35926.1 hypothetical protein TASI_0135 [Taylorella asinigenitalis MCE3]